MFPELLYFLFSLKSVVACIFCVLNLFINFRRHLHLPENRKLRKKEAKTIHHQLLLIPLNFKVSLLFMILHFFIFGFVLVLIHFVGLDAAIRGFCEFLEEFCGRAEIPSDDRDDAEWLQLPVADVRQLVNEILSTRTKKVLHLIPVDVLVRLLRVLDHQIHRSEGLSVNECEHVS